jgi:hypothetical protein
MKNWGKNAFFTYPSWETEISQPPDSCLEDVENILLKTLWGRNLCGIAVSIHLDAFCMQPEGCIKR